MTFGVSCCFRSGGDEASAGFFPIQTNPDMDLKLQRPAAACHETSEPFAPGDVMYSALVRDAGSLVRFDWSANAWSGPPPETLAWWRSIVPEQPDSGVSLAPVDVLLDTLEALENQPDARPLRYLLALQLVRRRVLRFAENSPEPEAVHNDQDVVSREETVAFFCRRRERDYLVVVANPSPEEQVGIEEQLASLLWSGGEP